MRYEIEVQGRRRQVQVTRRESAFAVEIDGRAWTVDAVRVDAGMLSLLLRDADPGAGPSAPGGASYEVVFAANSAAGTLTAQIAGRPVEIVPNTRRRRSGGSEGAGEGGPQRLTAPMPGKVVRVLVKPGESVVARQPIVVVEAMKMENELRAARDGRVSDVAVRDGESVEAGALLAVIADPLDSPDT